MASKAIMPVEVASLQRCLIILEDRYRELRITGELHIQALKAENEEQQHVLADLRSQLEEKVGRIEQLQAQKDEQIARLQLIDEEKQAESHRAKLMTSELEGVREEREKLTSELEGVREEREKLTSELEGVREEREKLTSELEGVREEREKLTSDLQDLTNEGELRSVQLHQVQEELREYFFDYRDSQFNLKQSREDVARLQSKLSWLRSQRLLLIGLVKYQASIFQRFTAISVRLNRDLMPASTRTLQESCKSLRLPNEYQQP
jgi:chromosome segregation ATPase